MKILECLKSAGKILHGNNHLWSVMKKSPVSRTRRFTYFQILCHALEKSTKNPESNTVWGEQLSWFKDSPQYRTLDTIDGEPLEFEWNVFQGFITLQFVDEVQEFMSKMVPPEQFKGRIITLNRNANLTPTSFLSVQEDFHQEDGHSSCLDQ